MIDPNIFIIQDMMQCGWDTTSFWLFSENVFSRLIYYSHTYPAGICLFLAAIILPLDSKNPINRTFFILSLAFATWCIFDFYLWATYKVDMTMFVWSMHAILEFIIYTSALFLLYYSIKRTHPPFIYFLVAFVISIPILALVPTAYNLTGFDYTNCDREAIEGILWSYIYIAELCTLIYLIIFGYIHQRTLTDQKERRSTILLTVGLALFLFFFLLGNIVGNFTLDWSIAQYGLIGMPILLTLLAYSITKYQTFNVHITTSVGLIFLMMAILYAYIFI